MKYKQKRHDNVSRLFLPFLVCLFFVFELFVSFLFNPLSFGIVDSVSAISLSGGDGLVVYGVSGNANPQFRLYTDSTNTFGSAANTVGGNIPSNVIVRTSPKKQEAIAGYVNSAGTLQVMCYDGNNWVNEWTEVVGGTGTTRRFDIAYETNSGDVMVVYSRNVATNNELGYRTKSGSLGCGASNWSSATNLNPARTSGVIQWVKLAWDRRLSSDIIAVAVADVNADLTAGLWSGTAWGNEPSSALATSLENIATAQDIESFDLDYESLTGDLMVIWGISVGNNTNGVRYITCTGGTSSCAWSGILTPPTFNDDASSLDLSANPNTDEMVFASIGQNQRDLQTGYWSGSTWTNTANRDTSAVLPAAGRNTVATGWLTISGTTRSIVVYADNTSTSTSLSYYTGNLGTFTAQTDFVMSPVPGAFCNFDIQQDPFNNDRLNLTFSDVNNDLFSKRLVMTAGPTLTWTNSDGGSALSASLTRVAPSPFQFSYWRSAPKFEQSAYRWFENNNASNAGVASINPSSSDEFVRDFELDSQFIYAVGHDAVPGDNQWRIEKRSVLDYDYDLGFGSSGVMANNPSVGGDDRAQEIEIDNSYLYVGGYDYNSGNTRWRIEKRNKTNGLTDALFGTLGVVTNNMSSGDDFIRSISSDSQYIYAVGVDATSSDNRWRIEKRNKSNGSLVGSFGTTGVVTVNPSAGDDQPLSVVVAGGYLFISGYDSVPGNKQIRIEKRNATTGALDNSFGVAGVISSNLGSGDDYVSKIKTDGSYFYSAGIDSVSGASNLRWRVEKRNITDGSFVVGFGSSGVVTSDPSVYNDELYDFDINGGYLYLGGSDGLSVSDYRWRMEKRSTTSGALDPSFGSSGVVNSDPGTGLDRVRAIGVLGDSLLVAGAGTNSSNLEWRFEKRSTSSGGLAKALASQNSLAALSKTNETFRLRLLMHITQSDLVSGHNFKLQFATKSGACDTAFSGESYSDVTASSSIAYYNNVSVTDGAYSISNPLDPDAGNTVKHQTYEELNDFTNNQSSISVGEDGLWDFSLWDKSAPVNTAYCFRMVKDDGNLIDLYSFIPEIVTAPGELKIDIVDVVGSSVDNPSVTLSDSIVSKTYQTVNGTMGISSEKIRVTNSTANPQWQISIASSGGSGSLWTGVGNSFDFNDPTASAGDGADTDTKGGRMTINSSGGTITPKAGCTNTGLSLGGSFGFSEGAIDSISLMSAGGLAGLNCFWDLMGVSVLQTVPSFQPSDTYSRPMVITITAL